MPDIDTFFCTFLGHDYYFISTSTSDDLHRRIGGRCTTHNMKIVFKVWGPPATPITSPPPIPTKPAWWPVVSSQRTTISTTMSITTVSTSSSTKKSKTYNKHPNEVVKSEELTLGGGTAIAKAERLVIVVSALSSMLIFAFR